MLLPRSLLLASRLFFPIVLIVNLGCGYRLTTISYPGAAGTELNCINDAGHIPNLEQPTAFNVKLAEFLARVVQNAARVQ